MIRISFAACLAWAFLLSAATPAPAGARTWHVDDDKVQMPSADFTLVQAAINAAADGDTIIVQRGFYQQPLFMNGKNVRLTSTGSGDPFTAQDTVLSAKRAGSAITLAGSETPDCIIEGFTIRDGVSKIGGGIYGGASRSRATIRNNVIKNNSGNDGGGIANCVGTIIGNAIVQNGAVRGGGLFQCAGQILNNDISENVASEGGGLLSCSGTIQKNLISRNSATVEGGGLARCLATVEGNVILENTAPEGGGLFLCAVRIADNFVFGNVANEGGGFYVCQGTIENNVIAKNGAISGGGFFGGSAFIRNNQIVGNYAEDNGGGFAEVVATTIENNKVHFNVALEDGGGFYGCTGLIARNDMLGNTANRGGALANCDARIERNSIGRNDAWLGGAAFACAGIFQNNLVQANVASRGQALDRCRGLIQNNTFAFNGRNPNFEGGDGAAVVIDESGFYVRNNIFYRNEDVEVLLVRLEPDANDKLFFENNLFHNPGHALVELSDRTRSFATVAAFESAYPLATRNIQGNPLFALEAGLDNNPFFSEDNDLTLKPNSPCIDAGHIEAMATMPVRDKAENSRMVNGAPDIGCFEFGSSADTDGDGLTDLIEAANKTSRMLLDTDGDGLTDAFELLGNSNPLVANASRETTIRPGGMRLQETVLRAYRGDTLKFTPGTYFGSASLMGKPLRIVGTKPIDGAVVAATILDGAGTGSIIALTGEEGAGTWIEGVTLRHGRGRDGGAVFGADLPVTILRCRIEENNTEVTGGALARLTGEVGFCTFTRNTSASGGAVADCRSTMHDNRFEANRSGITGGALFQCFGPITSNVFHANFSRQGGAASSIFGVLTGNTFTSNTATFGAGVFNASKTISGNKFLFNIGRDGGALLLCRARIENNEFTSNRADTGAALRGCQGDVVGNKFIGNFARVNGGALFGCLGSFQENVFDGNSSFSGGALAVCIGPFRANVVRDNSAETEGGALVLCNSDIENNKFENNSARDGGALFDIDGDVIGNEFRANAASAAGGGMMRAEGEMERNVFIGNSAAEGGAVHSFQGSIVNNRLQGNWATIGGGALSHCGADVFGNLFQGNSAPEGGAALAGRSDFRNNTLTENSAPKGGVLQDVTTGTVLNNIFAFNTGTAFAVTIDSARPVAVKANAFWSHGDGHYEHLGRKFASVTQLDAALAEAEGNFEFDPQFAASAGPDANPHTYADNDLRLQAGSPAIDRGIDLNGPATDLAGGPRLALGNRPTRVAIDLGAYEFLTISVFDPEHPITVRGGDALMVRWLADPRIAGDAIRFEMYDKELKVAELGRIATTGGGGTARLVVPDYLWKNRPYTLRATSIAHRDVWGKAPGSITLKSGGGGGATSKDGPAAGQNSVENWLAYP